MITELSTTKPKSMAPRLIKLPAIPNCSIALKAKSIDKEAAFRDVDDEPSILQGLTDLLAWKGHEPKPVDKRAVVKLSASQGGQTAAVVLTQAD